MNITPIDLDGVYARIRDALNPWVSRNASEAARVGVIDDASAMFGFLMELHAAADEVVYDLATEERMDHRKRLDALARLILDRVTITPNEEDADA